MRRLAGVAVVSLLILWALGAGFLWQTWKAKIAATKQSAPQTNAEQRVEARALLDRAVTARFGELTNEAMRLASEARRIDPNLPSAALFFAELSLRGGKTDNAEAAAKEALRREAHAANARLLLALNAWMLRGQTGTESAGKTAVQLLAEASEAELANNHVRFFAGDLLRAIGRPGEAHLSLLGSLYRQAPWDSSTLLLAKLWLALEEAGPSEESGTALATGPEGALYGAAAARLQRAFRGGDVTISAFDGLQTLFTAKQTAVLLSDSAMGAVPLIYTQNPDRLFPPFTRIDPPTRQIGSAAAQAWEDNASGPERRHRQLPEGVQLGD